MFIYFFVCVGVIVLVIFVIIEIIVLFSIFILIFEICVWVFYFVISDIVLFVFWIRVFKIIVCFVVFFFWIVVGRRIFGNGRGWSGIRWFVGIVRFVIVRGFGWFIGIIRFVIIIRGRFVFVVWWVIIIVFVRELGDLSVMVDVVVLGIILWFVIVIMVLV